MTGRIAPLALALGACTASPPEPEPRREPASFRSAPDHCAFTLPGGWQPARERDTLVLAGHDATIAVRTAPRDRSDAELEQATAEVLRERATGPARELEVMGARALAYDLAFRDRETEWSYDRTHVLVLAAHHAFHVLHTAAAGRLAATAPDFQRVLDSFQETP